MGLEKDVTIGLIIGVYGAVCGRSRIGRNSVLFEDYAVQAILEVHDRVRRQVRVGAFEDKPVGLGPAPQLVGSALSEQYIGAAIAVYLIIAIPAIEPIIANAAVKRVV